MAQRQSAPVREKEVDDELVLVFRLDGSTHDDDNTCEDGDFRVLPPLLAAHGTRSAAERVRLTRERVSLVDEEVKALAALQDRVDVLHHDVLAVSVS